MFLGGCTAPEQLQAESLCMATKADPVKNLISLDLSSRDHTSPLVNLLAHVKREL